MDTLIVTFQVDQRKLGLGLGYLNDGNNIITHHVLLGNSVQLNYVMNAPTFNFNAENDCYYTLVMLNSCNRSNNNSRENSILHWMLVNIPGNNMLGGEVKSQYIAPNPSINTEDRYVLLMFQQTSDYQSYLSLQNRFTSRNVNDRDRFNLKEFENDYKLELVALNFFFCQGVQRKRKLDLDLQKCLVDPRYSQTKKSLFKDF